jgi:hypothetical protein
LTGLLESSHNRGLRWKRFGSQRKRGGRRKKQSEIRQETKNSVIIEGSADRSESRKTKRNASANRGELQTGSLKIYSR